MGIGVNNPNATLHINDESGPGMALPGQPAPLNTIPLIRFQSFDPNGGLYTNYWDFRMDLGSSLRFFQANSTGASSEKLMLGSSYVKVFDKLKVSTNIELATTVTPDGTLGNVLSLGLTELGTAGAWQGNGAALFTNSNGELFYMYNQGSILNGASAMMNNVPFRASATGIGVLGSVKINTDNDFGYALAVNGEAIFNKVVIKTYPNWPDYVFASNYRLMSLSETELFIQQNHHLPGVPSANEVVENGIDLAEMNAILLKKVEELTLQLIEVNKQLQILKNEK